MPTSQDVLLAWHRLRNALGAAGVGTWHLDLRTNVAIHDESLNRILGLDAVETEGSLDDTDFTRIHPDDNARVLRDQRCGCRAPRIRPRVPHRPDRRRDPLAAGPRADHRRR